jgi:acyl-CoA thioester hydrolase
MSESPPPRAKPLPRGHFARFQAIATRWSDNDVDGHMNNVVHYSLFDTAVYRTLIEAGVLAIHGGRIIGLVVHTQCHCFDSIAFPQTLQAGLTVAHLDRSSVRYELGVFADDAPWSAAVDEFTHVDVHRASRRPVELPADWRAFFEPLRKTA